MPRCDIAGHFHEGRHSSCISQQGTDRIAQITKLRGDSRIFGRLHPFPNSEVNCVPSLRSFFNDSPLQRITHRRQIHESLLRVSRSRRLLQELLKSLRRLRICEASCNETRRQIHSGFLRCGKRPLRAFRYRGLNSVPDHLRQIVILVVDRIRHQCPRDLPTIFVI